MAAGRRKIGASIGLVPFFVYVGIFLLIPTVVVFIQAFTASDGGFTLEGIKALTKPSTIQITQATLILSLTTAVVGAAVGAMVAYVVSTGERDGLLRRVVTSGCGVLAQFGGVTLAFAFIATIGRQGVVTPWLNTVGINLKDSTFLFSLEGLTLVYTYFQIPLMVIVFLPAVDGIRPQWREAADTLGATTWQFWRHVGIPLLFPAFLGSMLLLFANAFATYSTAAALINQASPILSLEIGNSLGNELLGNQGNLAASLAFEMVVIVALVMFVYSRLQKRTSGWLQ